MDVDSAATFLACSVLIALGFGSIAIVTLYVNNLFSKYWKPVKLTIIPPVEYRYIDPEAVQRRTNKQNESAQDPKQ